MRSRLTLRMPLLFFAGLVVLLLPAGRPTEARVAVEASGAKPTAPQGDGLVGLAPGLQARSIAALIHAGLVHPQARPLGSEPAAGAPRNPASSVTWGPARNMSNTPGAGSPSAALHPLDPLLALSGGDLSAGDGGANINNSADGGNTWQSREAPITATLGQGAVTWLASRTANGLGGRFVDVASGADGADLQLSGTTDGGATWTALSGANVDAAGYFDDLPHLWTDQNPASPYYGRLYLTEALLDSAGAGSYDTVAVRWSGDDGATWSAPTATLVDATEFARHADHNEFPTLAVQPDGAIVAAWHRGMCCGGPSPVNAPNKVMVDRSTDGGVTWAISQTVTTVPLAESVPWQATSPGGFYWTDTPQIAADPVDGTLYAVWVAYRAPGAQASAGVFLSRGTPDATSWTAPVIVDDADRTKYQYFPWVQVSQDHVVHVTYSKAVAGNTDVGHFYTQSTDRGTTWSTAFQLSNATYAPAGYMGLYQEASVGGYQAQHGVSPTGSILATWTDTTGGAANQWGRVGVFPQGGPTLTPTPSPSATPTSTPSPTPCPTCFGDVHPGDYFYTAVEYLAARGVVSGYADGTFRPYNPTTRAQMVKIVVLAFAVAPYTPPDGAYTFADVPRTQPFWGVIETAAHGGIVGGYACGGPNEACDPLHRPYFRPYVNVTRGQLSKIVVNSAGWPLRNSAAGTFEDVAPASPFYPFVETASCYGVVSGYACGGPGEGCDASRRPYFRPGNSATRGQIAKIVYGAILNPPACGLNDN